MDLFCAGIFQIYHINRPQDNTVATELFFLRWKFVIEETDCSVNLKYKSDSLAKHTAIKTKTERKPGKLNYAFRTVPKQRPEQTEILEWQIK